MLRKYPQILPLTFLGISFLLQPGCSPQSDPTDQFATGSEKVESRQGGVSSRTESSQHKSHIDPKHKPETFPLAVHQLRKLLTALQNPPGENERFQIWHQAKDTIRWLPELGAESELDESAWNRIVELSDQLDFVLGVSPSVELGQVSPVWDLCDQLDRLVAAFDEAESKFLRRMGMISKDQELPPHGR